jgi:putative DNA primase/helicase
MNDRPITVLLGRLDDVRRSGAGKWLARCPAHNDENPSLSLREGNDGRVLLKCHAGCSLDAVLAALGLRKRDLFPSRSKSDRRGGTNRETGTRPTRPAARAQSFASQEELIAEVARRVGGKHVQTWSYHDASGNDVFRVARFDLAGGTKTLRPFYLRPGGPSCLGSGICFPERWVLSDPPGPLPLYRLPALAAPGTVFVLEGEKCAELAAGLQLLATTSAHGSQAVAKTDWTPLCGRDVVVLPDADATGHKYATDVAAQLTALKPPASVRIVHLPGLADGEDIEEFIAARREQPPEAIRAEIERLAGEAKTVTPPPPRANAKMAIRPAPGADSPVRKKADSDRTNFQHADAFIKEHFSHKDGFRAGYWRNQLYEWRDNRYQPLDTDYFLRVVLKWLDSRTDEASPGRAKAVATCIESRLLLPVESEEPAWLGAPELVPLDPTNWIVVKNGILDIGPLAEGHPPVLHPHTPLWFCTTSLPYWYDAEAKCPTWCEFLHDAFDGDDERVQALGEFFGLALTCDTKYQKVLLLVGPPRSGKGTALRALRALVGEHSCASPRLSLLGETFGLQGLLGKTLAICPDAHLGRGDKAVGVLETLKSISGEDAIEVNRKYLPQISIRLHTRFAIAVNELPRFDDSSNALLARLLIIPFNRSFVGKENRNLEARLMSEQSGILNWAIAGLCRLRRQGRFTEPSASADIAEDFRRFSSPITAFLDDCCVTEPNAVVDRDQLYTVWRQWCQANGFEPGTKGRFGSRLRAAVPGLGRRQPRESGAKRGNLYAGVGLRMAAVEGTGGTGGTA